MREVIPCISVLAVVLANSSPLPLTQVWAPFFPRSARFTSVVQPLLLCYVSEVLLAHGFPPTHDRAYDAQNQTRSLFFWPVLSIDVQRKAHRIRPSLRRATKLGQ